jgi:hypothetical protein
LTEFHRLFTACVGILDGFGELLFHIFSMGNATYWIVYGVLREVSILMIDNSHNETVTFDVPALKNKWRFFL